MKTYTLKVSGTQSYTLKCGPSRFTWSGRVEGDTAILTGRRKPLLRWWFELARWRLGRVLRRTPRIKVDA